MTSASTFGWLAYSERELRQAHDLASSLSERETRDELGIGSIRDAIADRLFPGTSTIQSRARYFLFLPWIFQDLERQVRGRSRERGEHAERTLISQLRQSNDTRGLVGGRRTLVERLPSAIYWNGLSVLGIRRVARPLSAYYRWLDDPTRAGRIATDDDGVPIEGIIRTWWDSVPPAPEGFPHGASFRLTPEESEYLSIRAVASTPYETTLAFLFREGRPDVRVDLPWRHPQRANMPDSVQDDLDVAERFSLLHHGAALLYNLQIAEARNEPPRKEDYERRLEEWQEHALAPLEAFDLGRVWQLAPHAHRGARRFVQDWLNAVRRADGRPLSRERSARELVAAREARVKGRARSRIYQPFRVGWSGASGSAQLDYRWSASVQQIVLDLAEARPDA
jgi:hypothetical protein